MFLNLFILSLLAVVAAARLGGWQSADPKDVEVIKNVLFALNTRFPEVDPKDISPSSFKIIDVKKQVVAGLLYDVIVDYTPPAKTCEVLHFQVGDRWGTLSLLVNEVLTNPCTV
mmetsp:Transcript_29591/g.50758  ORF Transcript_29591/g.50758 Transcript_29591/m.50758 type:complete len:114 (-) Transcript_29591:863-1204(-)|eukprot:CAMPEP_0184973800 /NCGR_PEP_ID=MMETSP1098-20130426/5435_1 /TAXON_ID=89044 /ORGANISM="Spumella elongata, Strain CCAP 955/1" /LENGTH=113 /DNA_ID=CAMNT_0027496293 /DNA_START=20 /DNA_END=361 /DNA_ORIENTATION=-